MPRKTTTITATQPATKKSTGKAPAEPAVKITKANASAATANSKAKKSAVTVPVKAAPKTASKAAPKAAPKKTTKKTASPDPLPADAPKVSKRKAEESAQEEAPTKRAKVKTAVSSSLPAINEAPRQKLDVFVFGEGSQGELGLGATKYLGKQPIDVKRPRINHLLSANTVGVVQVAVGGMHCAALTYDNQILTWGVNDQGALGRNTAAGPMKDMKEDGDSSDSEDEDVALNPTESEPHAVNASFFPEGTIFCQLAASDSATFALTTTGLVYGWGTFRGNDGILGFRSGSKIQATPALIPELKKIKMIAAGTNHAIAIDEKGRAFNWGAGEQHQLARRVVSRTAVGALIPREFGLQRKKIVFVGCGDYHSFAIDKDGQVYSWGLNTFGQTGIPKPEDDDDDDANIVGRPVIVDNLADYDIKQITGGSHHTIAVTTEGKVLVWGRIDNAQSGMEMDDLPKESLYVDDQNRARYLTKPVQIPDIVGDSASISADTSIVITKDGTAYSWGFSANYQTGLGTTEDIVEATLIDNTAVHGKKLSFAGAGGQFSVLAGPASEESKHAHTNGIINGITNGIKKD